MKKNLLRGVPLLVLVAAALALSSVETGPISKETAEMARSVRETALREGRATDWVRQLTDEVGPRLAGSAGDRAAGLWAKKLMTSLGFSNVRLEGVVANSWERISESGELTGPITQRLVLTALGGSVPTPAEGIEAEIVEAPSLEAFDEMVKKDPRCCTGKIVFFNKRMARRSDDMSGYGGSVPVRATGASRAAKAGAIGVLIRSIGTSKNRYAHTGSVRYEEAVPKVPAAALSNPDADLLERLVSRGSPVRVRFRLDCRTLEKVETANIVGEVLGREKPDEVVVLSGHIDSWDLGTGAIDDAAGCGMSIEAARLIGSLPRRPLRTVRVVLFANEENGLAGGHAYARQHAAELGRHAGVMEADSGTGRPIGFAWNADPSARPIIGALAKLLAPIDATKMKAGGYGGADISPLSTSDVPLFGLRQDTSTYFDYHHTQNDTFDKIEPESMRKATAALAVWAYVVADLPEGLPRGRIEKK